MSSSISAILAEKSFSTLAIGAFIGFVLQQLPALGNFLCTNFLRRSGLPKYLHDSSNEEPEAWALVTGASDGIGFGFATELAKNGFNVVLHGRNRSKLEAKVKELLSTFPDRNFQALVFDASQSTPDSKLEHSVKLSLAHNPNLTVLVNNIGGFSGLKPFITLDSYNAKETQTLLDINITFATQITRILLPTLRANEPSLILNVGSSMGSHPMPYLGTYCGAKAFNAHFSRALRLEMQAERNDVEVLALDVARVKSQGSGDIELGFFTPDSRNLAKHALQKVGCGKDIVHAYWPHALQGGLMSWMPSWLYDRILIDAARKEQVWFHKMF